MPSFASNARFKAKSGQENALMEASLKFDIADYAGCLSHQCIGAGDGRFQLVAVWESEDTFVNARPLLIKFRDTLRPMLEEISPELGVTDPISGYITGN